MLSGIEPLGYLIKREDNLTLICRPALAHLWELARAKGPMGEPTTLTGRSALRFIEPDMVVRTLIHGGVFRHITSNRFISPNRTMRELKVSSYLTSHGISTPEILAVRLIKGRFFYSIDVISRFIPDSMDLLVFYENARQNSPDLFLQAGMLIRKIHDLGVYHADLHIKNLLLGSTGELWLLDLDKAYLFHVLPGFMKQMNLNRFIRSVEKWQMKGRIHLPDTWEHSFRTGYGKVTG